MRKTGEWKPMPQKVRHIRELMDLFAALTEDEKFLDLVEILEGDGTMRPLSGLDVIENRGFERGISQGISQGESRGRIAGIKEKTISVVTNMLKKIILMKLLPNSRKLHLMMSCVLPKRMG